MRKEIVYEVEKHKPIVYPKIDGWDEDIVETAGFIPLEVRIKQMEQAGFRAQFFESEFTSKDVSDMYLNHPEFDITVEDDIEEALEKIAARESWIKEVQAKARAKKESADRTAEKEIDTSKDEASKEEK